MEPNRILCAAHPDDEILSASSMIPGSIVIIVTNGDLGRPADCEMTVEEYSAARMKESVVACERYHAAQVILMGYSETKLGANDPQIFNDIETLVKKYNPEVIYTHHPRGSQQICHINLGIAMEKMFSEDIFMLYFCDPHFSPKHDQPVISVALGEEQWNEKRDVVVNVFKTQSNWLVRHFDTNHVHHRNERFWR